MRFYASLDRQVTFVQIFGERNSGTDFLRKTMQSSLKDTANILGIAKDESAPYGSNIFGYKHWFPDLKKLDDARQENTLFVVIYRNPYTWLRAMMERPYALEKSIAGKEVKELPSVKLVGHIKGRDTTNEFDPMTGDQLNIFELRRLKILALEKLRDHVANIIYVNLEEYLVSHAALFATLAAAFPSGFSVDGKPSLDPPRKLVRECFSPVRFSDDEIDVINRNLDWDTERSIGYGEGSYQLGARV